MRGHKQNNNNTTGLLAGYLGTADGWEARCGRFLGEGREFLADMRCGASPCALSISWKDEPRHRDAALSRSLGDPCGAGLLLTPPELPEVHRRQDLQSLGPCR
jgi:hypothetical protein